MKKAAIPQSFGGGAISESLYKYILEKVPEGKTILEFGSGYGTDKMLEHYKVISIEHDKQYFSQRPKKHKAFLAEIKNGWFDSFIVREALKMKFDFLLVDGPPGGLRKGLLDHLQLFSEIKCPVIFDDVNRRVDRQVMESFCRVLGYDYTVVEEQEKSYAICMKSKSKKGMTTKIEKRNEIACYTVITGGYDNLVRPAVVSDNVDYICFTDNPLMLSDVWQIIPIEKEEDPVKLQRKVKILAHKYLHKYATTVYMDGNMMLKDDLNKLLSYFSGGLMVKLHPYRKNIFKEGEKVVQSCKANGVDVDAQLDKYRSAGYDKEGLYETGLMIRDNSQEVAKLCDAWWKEVKEHTHRDQISLPYVAHIQGVDIMAFGKTLFERFCKIHYHARKPKAFTKIWYGTPADAGKNIGRAYNEFCALIPNDEDWICIRDGDTCFLTDDWMKQIEDIVRKYGDTYQLYGCVTNRLGSTYQRPFPEDFEDPDILKAGSRAKELHDTAYDVVTPHDREVAGMFMLFQKKTWLKNKFKENDYCADSLFGKGVIAGGGKIGLINGLYLFHWYRFDKPNPQKHLKHLQK